MEYRKEYIYRWRTGRSIYIGGVQVGVYIYRWSMGRSIYIGGVEVGVYIGGVWEGVYI